MVSAQRPLPYREQPIVKTAWKRCTVVECPGHDTLCVHPVRLWRPLSLSLSLSLTHNHL
jgi:hypothetical protein